MKIKKSRGKEFGKDFPFKCSVCSSQSFSLIKLGKSSSLDYMRLLVRILLMGKEKWILRCDSCCLEVSLKNDEVEEVKNLFTLHESLQNGQIDEKEFFNAVVNSESPTVRELYTRSLSWSCPGCENEIPMTFETCWNCGEECPDPENLLKVNSELTFNDCSVFGSSFSVNEDEK